MSISATRSPGLTSTRSKRVVVRYEFRGAARAVFPCRDDEILLDGPAGTGKSLGCLMKVHIVLSKYPRSRGLLVRKTMESLKTSALVTFQKFILHEASGITFFGGNNQEPPHYRYPNGSKLMLGGMDKPKKVMSTEYDIIYAQEATELTEEDWESLTTRLRNAVVPYQQIIADCNPDAPTHWLNLRCERGDTTRLVSRHEDNPALYDVRTETWTPFGIHYMARLDRLTGVRKVRLRGGKWAAAEGIVYEGYDERIHLIDTPPPGLRNHFAAQDWGYTNPGVLGVFGEDSDGGLCLVAEYYMTGQTIDWWIVRAKALHAEYRLQSIQCDPSEPGYIDQYKAAKLPAVKGINAIPPGIGAVQQRLALPANGRPRLLFCRNALRERDEALLEARLPICTVHEFSSFVWPKDVAGRAVKEIPAPGIDHGMDMLRYAIAHKDILPARSRRIVSF
jgi:PBSX family phage terminase large subunit